MTETLSIAQAAKIKDVTRQTIYNNINHFDLSESGRIIPNAKFDKWKPQRERRQQK